MAGFKDHFSGVAEAYRAFRPGYPVALFSWMAAVAPGTDLAADLGCGNGQAAVSLATYFAEVVGVDPSSEQIARAEQHPRVRYVVAPAERTSIPGGTVDLALAAQSFHWFDPEPFRVELQRIARPGAVFVACTYGLCRICPEVDEVVDLLYGDLLGPWWPPERRHVESGYQTLPFPADELEVPRFEIAEEWPLEQFLGYLGTWSAVGACRRATRRDSVAELAPELRKAWGSAGARRQVRWPLVVRAGRVGGAVASPHAPAAGAGEGAAPRRS